VSETASKLEKIAGQPFEIYKFLLSVGEDEEGCGENSLKFGTRCISLMSFHCPVHEDPLGDMGSLLGVY